MEICQSEKVGTLSIVPIVMRVHRIGLNQFSALVFTIDNIKVDVDDDSCTNVNVTCEQGFIYVHVFDKYYSRLDSNSGACALFIME